MVNPYDLSAASFIAVGADIAPSLDEVIFEETLFFTLLA
jgi:hypothetical protein